MSLPTDAKARKDIPVYSGFVKYFPDAMVAVAQLSKVGNDQHNPGQPLHWAKEKSTDELDALMRHLIDDACDEPVDSDGILHITKVAWRAMANLQRALDKQKEHEKLRDMPLNALKPAHLSDPPEKIPSMPGEVIYNPSKDFRPHPLDYVQTLKAGEYRMPPPAKMKRFVEGNSKGEYIGLSNPDPEGHDDEGMPV